MPRRHVEDPISISMHRLASPRRMFIILGEIHNQWEKKRCPSKLHALSLVAFFKQLAETLPTVDFFIELPLPLTKKANLYEKPFWHWINRTVLYRERFRHGLTSLAETFGACVPKYKEDRSKCLLPPTARVHFVDMRHPENWREDGVEEMNMFMKNIDMALVMDVNDRIVYQKACDFVKLCEQLFKVRMRLWKTFLSKLKIQKQLDAIPIPGIKKKLMEWARKKWIQHWQLIDELRDEFYAQQKVVPGDFISSDIVEKMSLHFLYLSAFVVDLYTMGRALRDFSDGTHATNVVTYVGNFHAENYREMLKLLGARTVVRTVVSKDRTACLSVQDIMNKIT